MTGDPVYEQTTCWWHPDRPTGLRCTRCERYACPDCLRDAAVGYQCVDCVTVARRQQKAQAVAHRRSGFGYRTVAGARATSQIFVTPALIALNVAAYLITAVQAQSPMNNAESSLFGEGVLFPPLIAVDGEWWRLITSGFLHYGPIHLLMNMLALWLIGRDLELLLGKARYVALYGLSLLGGSAAALTFSEVYQSTAGASGAVYGLLGGILLAAIRLKLNLTPILVIIAFNLFFSIQIPQISLSAHLGGLVVGALITAAMVYAPEKQRTAIQAGTALSVLIALGIMIVARDAQLAQAALVSGDKVLIDQVLCDLQTRDCWLPG